MASYGAGDALRRTVEVLIANPGGVSDIDQIKDAITQLIGVLDTSVSVMRGFGAGTEEIAAAVRPTSATIQQLIGLLKAFETSTNATAEAKQRTATMIEEADERIAHAEAMAWMEGEERTRKLDAEAGRTAFLTRQVNDLDAALTQMHAHEASAPRATPADMMGVGAAQRERIEALAAAERGTRQWADSMERLREKFGPTSNAATQFSRQLLFVSYAAQDLYQGGFSAILNNIPQLAMAFGASTPVMASMAIGALGLDVAFKTLGPTVRQLAVDLGALDDPTKAFVTNTDQASARLEALTHKPWKVDVDYKDIEEAKKEVDALRKAFAAYEAGRVSAAQRDMASQATDVTGKFLGGTEKLRDVLLLAAGAGKFDLGEPADGEKGAAYRRLLAELKDLEAKLANPDAMLNPEDPFAVRNAEQRAAAIRNELTQSRKELAMAAAGRFSLGDEKTVAQVQALARDEPGLFGHIGPGGKTGATAVADLPPTQAEAERRAEVLRSAHEAISDAQTDEDVTPGEKMQTIADQVNRLSAIPGEAGRKAHEAAKRALAAARKAYEAEVKGAEDEAAKAVKEIDAGIAKEAAVPEVDDATNLAAWNRAGQERAHRLRNRLSELVMHKDEPADQRQAGIKEVLDEIAAHSMALKDKDVADLKLAAKNAGRQVGGQAQRAAADDIRDSIRDIGISGQDAGGKQQALQGVAARINQQAATLGEELVGDLMRQARAAFQAAARQGDAQLKHDMAEEAKAQREGRPGPMIHRAAAPLVDQAVAKGIKPADARRDIEQEIQRGLMDGMDLQHSTQRAALMLAGYVEMMQHENQMLRMQVNRIGANMHANQGGGLPSLLSPVRAGR